ncbi:MAG: hypothetical protein V7704_16665 [Aurantimonas endophytica]|uniref:Uncharacterized protein n=1 Tax=Aurantimonas endophytica TaxID=1522175 RepID=A0A7W6HB03_9HYPH|nr:hypothetical protein [Aurantimonas endophytica]MBB4001838.1 hypothetical protein [Aurantimonas endophytica]MCO6402525.1 hypothetical protein [Aurantimonas endophytica]
MLEIPPLDSLAIAFTGVGLLFFLRYFLAMRRIWKVVGYRPSFQFGDFFRATRREAFGPDLEPERRYAARQLVIGSAMLLTGLVLFAWLLATGTPIRLDI